MSKEERTNECSADDTFVSRERGGRLVEDVGAWEDKC